MHRVFLTFLAVALVTLAVPLQGMAAVVAAQCMAFGHHSEGASQNVAVDHAQDGAHEDDHAAHSHSDESKSAGEGGKLSHCGPCVACCASASMAGPVASLPIPVSPFVAIYVFSQVPPPAFEPDGLDRPPLAL